MKITEYVEDVKSNHDCVQENCRYYIVLENETGDVIVTEKLQDGMVTWSENPKNLETRNSLAKVFSCTDSRNANITVRDIKNVRANEITWKRPTVSASVISRRYAQV